jgi:hypothetical protein
MDEKKTKSKPTAASPESKTLKETKSKPTIADPQSKKEARFKIQNAKPKLNINKSR